jgi:murein DD-endopeptidase MepM/ murein hydrolase activator NlpD
MRRIRIFAAVAIATLSWVPLSIQPVSAIYCYSGDPPAVYQACLAYNNGIGQQVNNQNQLQNIQSKINDAVAQINAIDTLIANLKNQIAAQQALIAQTQSAIDDLNRQIRFGEADLTRLVANTSVRDELLNQRLRYIDSHGALNYVQLVLTASSFNQMMDRMVAAQQIAASDRKLLNDLAQEHSQVALANSALDDQKSQVTSLLQQQKASEADMQNNLKAQAAAVVVEQQLEVQLAAQKAQIQKDRAAIDAQVAQLAQQYDAAAIKAGGGSGVFEWPEPACGPNCISQGFGCSSFYLEGTDPSVCPIWPYRAHTGIDIAGPYGTQIVAADTGYAILGYCWYCGNYIIMTHGNGYSTYYGHLSRYAPGLSNGEIVPRGTTIAFEGTTGLSTGPHVHFEIRINGAPKNPCIWLGC